MAHWVASPHLFLSYAPADHAGALCLGRALEAAGHPVWLPPSTRQVGDVWKQAIQTAIQTSYAVLLAITPAYFTCEHTLNHELRPAFERFEGALAFGERRILPIWLEDVPREMLTAISDPQLRDRALAALERIGQLQAVDARHGDFERAAREVSLPEPSDEFGESHPFLVDWPRLEDFSGRTELLNRLHGLLGEGSVSLHAGQGGIGKTQLAVEYSHCHRFHYPAGVYWINGAASWEDGIAALAERLGLTPLRLNTPDYGKQMVGAFLQYLAQRRKYGQALIVLDNVNAPLEMMESAIGLQLRSFDPSIRLLLITDDLDTPSGFMPLAVPTLETEPDTALAILRGAQPDTDSVILDELCRAVGYLPLTLRLTAGALNVATPRALLAHLRDHGAAHSEGVMTDYLLEWHWENLARTGRNVARRTLALAAAFGRGAMIPLARLRFLVNVPAPVFDDALAGLSRARLIETLRGGIGLHPLVRDFVRRRSSDSLAEAVEHLRDAYRRPEIVAREVEARGFSALVVDLRETRRALSADASAAQSLDALANLFEREAYLIHDRLPGARHVVGHTIQHLRERAHQQGDDPLRDACDAWLEPYAHLRTEHGWRCSDVPSGERILALAVSRDGRWIYSFADKGVLSRWDASTGERLRRSEAWKHSLSGTLTPDGQYALCALAEVVIVRDVDTEREVRRFTGHGAPVMAVAMTPDGRYVVTGSVDRTLRLWEFETGRELRRFGGHTDAVRSIAISADGRALVSASSDRTLRLWNLETGEMVRQYTGHKQMVNSVTMTRDASLILSAASDRTARVWETATGRELRRFTGHDSWLWGVVVSEDARLAFTIADDRTLRLWTVATGENLATLRIDGMPSALAILPGSPPRAVVGDWSGNVRVVRAALPSPPDQGLTT